MISKTEMETNILIAMSRHRIALAQLGNNMSIVEAKNKMNKLDASLKNIVIQARKLGMHKSIDGFMATVRMYKRIINGRIY